MEGSHCQKETIVGELRRGVAMGIKRETDWFFILMFNRLLKIYS